MEANGTSNGNNTKNTPTCTASGNGTSLRLQTTVDTTLRRQAEDVYKRLITAAYTLAVDGQPLSAFRTIVSCLKSNGVKLIQGCDNKQKAKEFTVYLAEAVRTKIGQILGNSTAFGILCDGSQARKTGKEKELVLARTVASDGKSKYYIAGLQDMDSFGSANSENIKRQWMRRS